MPLETLNLDVIDIDSVKRTFEVLEADLGSGYHEGVNVGAAGGLHTWTLSSGCLPDDDDAAYLPVGSDSRFAYLWDFYQARLEEGNGPFIIEFRGKDYHAAFAETSIDMERFTNDLFAGGLVIKQRRILGETYASDGSIPEEEP
jgi:hypothetical protein